MARSRADMALLLAALHDAGTALPVEHFAPMVHDVLRHRPRRRSFLQRARGRARRLLR